jgi:hypothetical protein
MKTWLITVLLVLSVLAVVTLWVMVLPVRWRGNEHTPPYSLLNALKDHHRKHKTHLDVDQCYNNLDTFKQVTAECNLPFFLSEGTALGALREKRILPWDDDVDVALLQEYQADFMKCAHPKLKQAGFVYTHGRLNFLGYYRGNEKVDVSFIGDGLDGLEDSQVLLSLVKKVRPVTLENGEVYMAPENLDYLVFLYGPNWQVPDTTKSTYTDSRVPASS